MAYQTIFKRYELKYLLTLEQADLILKAMRHYMRMDKYGKTTIRNIYYDTPDYRLIRQSIDKPVYKEKLRIRSYSLASADSTVFVELKKKYKGVVYKRRISLAETDAMAWVGGIKPCPVNTQISREIDYFLSYYGHLQPTVFLSYDREAYYDLNGGDFRVTFDTNIQYRTRDLSLCAAPYGTPILPQDKVLMEIKSPGGIPLWMVHALSEAHLSKTSFSKYGTVYINHILPQRQNIKIHSEVSQYA